MLRHDTWFLEAAATPSPKINAYSRNLLMNVAMLNPSYNPFSTEIWAQIAWQIDSVRDLLALSATSHLLRLICTDDQLWKQLCVEHYAVDYTHDNYLNQYKSCLQDKSMRRVCRHLMGFTNNVLLEKSTLYKSMSLNKPCSQCHAICQELYMCMHGTCDEALCSGCRDVGDHHLFLRVSSLWLWCTRCRTSYSMSVGRALGVCNASKSEQFKVDHMLDVVTKDNNNGRSALDKFRFRIFERNLEVEEQRELSQLPEDQYKVHIISRDWLQCWGHWLHGGVPPSAIDQNMLVDKNGSLRVPEKSLDGWSLGFIGPRLWNHLKDSWGVNGPELTEDDAQGEEYEEIRMRLKLWKQSLKNLAVSPH